MNKLQAFNTEPFGEKEVTAIYGVGKVLGERLISKGFDKAYRLLGQFLILKKDEIIYKEWLKEICGANSQQAEKICSFCKQWCNLCI